MLNEARLRRGTGRHLIQISNDIPKPTLWISDFSYRRTLLIRPILRRMGQFYVLCGNHTKGKSILMEEPFVKPDSRA